MSDEAKPTPGPWEASYATIGPITVDQLRRVEGREGFTIVVLAPTHPPLAPGYDYTVALVGTVLDSDAATSEANARLVAAAPDMLAALEAIVDEAPDEEPEYGDWGGDTEDAETWGLGAAAWKAASIARVAIAKATGES